MGRHLDIDFCAILVDLGSQVGKENETKIKIKKGQNLKGFWWGGGPGHVGEEFSPSLVGGILRPKSTENNVLCPPPWGCQSGGIGPRSNFEKTEKL